MFISLRVKVLVPDNIFLLSTNPLILSDKSADISPSLSALQNSTGSVSVPILRHLSFNSSPIRLVPDFAIKSNDGLNILPLP